MSTARAQSVGPTCAGYDGLAIALVTGDPG
jgi:hypothetical protein